MLNGHHVGLLFPKKLDTLPPIGKKTRINGIYLIGTEIYARILQRIKAVRRSSPVKFYRSRC